MTFLTLNAQDGAAGEAAFDKLSLRGHPAFVIVQPDGAEIWRAIGEQSPGDLEDAIDQGLAE